MISRSEVEHAIVDEESMLEHVAGLLASQTDISGWAEEARAALALPAEVTAAVQQEAQALLPYRQARHAFGVMRARVGL